MYASEVTAEGVIVLVAVTTEPGVNVEQTWLNEIVDVWTPPEMDTFVVVVCG